MGSVIAEGIPLGIEDYSLLVSSPRYKRRKVSATRDFPDGCSPYALEIISENKQDKINGQKEGGVLSNVMSSSENDGVICQVVRFTDLEGKHESQKHVSDNKVVDEVTSVQPCLLPHYPMPPNFVWKLPMYPSRRNVSAIRDFPIGCGENVPKLGDIEEEHVGHDETSSKSHEVIDPTVIEGVDKVSEVFEGPLSESYERKVRDEFSKEKIGEKNENGMEQLECDGNVESIVGFGSDKKRVIVLGLTSELHFPLKLCDELKKEVVVNVNNKREREKSADFPCKNVKLQEENVVGSDNKRVIVLGLACHSPLRHKKGFVKKASNTTSVKELEGKKKCNISREGTRKSSPDKSKDENKNMEGKNMICPYLEEDIDEISKNDDISVPPLTRSKLRETLRLFEASHRKLLQEETKLNDQENGSKRIDLQATKVVKDRGKNVNAKKIIGSVLGIEVGDLFNNRSELSVFGLHTPLEGDIDMIELDNEPLAISIVANDVASSDVVIYTGQGGNSFGQHKQLEDQWLEKGNLALKNCIEKKTLVRVIRGLKESNPLETLDGKSKTIATYTYDGLYTVVKYWPDLGPHGKLVYKFELNRVPGQPEPAWKVEQSKNFTGCYVADISDSRENLPIRAINTVDNQKPPTFTYITSMMYPDWCRPIHSKGCDCKNGCSYSLDCACAFKNGREIPFNDEGALLQVKPFVYECGPLCKCPPFCHNRVSQHGIKLPLEVFKTNSMGWGVRCRSLISSGSFICEYVGELLDDKEAEQRTNDEYLFGIGKNGSDIPLLDGFAIDAAKYGNIGRFINHSCSPNLVAQDVLYDHEDKRIPHVMLFAGEDIPPLKELTYDYNYAIDQVCDSEGRIKKKKCFCGSEECTGWMY